MLGRVRKLVSKIYMPWTRNNTSLSFCIYDGKQGKGIQRTTYKNLSIFLNPYWNQHALPWERKKGKKKESACFDITVEESLLKALSFNYKNPLLYLQRTSCLYNGGLGLKDVGSIYVNKLKYL